MPWGNETRGAVAVTFRVPGNSFNAYDAADDGAAILVTMLVNPDEARGMAQWLQKAADAADEAGPPVFQFDASPDDSGGPDGSASPDGPEAT